MVKDFIDQNQSLWNGKRIFVIATMGLFSGDGAGLFGQRLYFCIKQKNIRTKQNSSSKMCWRWSISLFANCPSYGKIK